MTMVFVGWSQEPCSSSEIIILLTMLYTRFSGSSNMVHSWSRDRLEYWALWWLLGKGVMVCHESVRSGRVRKKCESVSGKDKCVVGNTCMRLSVQNPPVTPSLCHSNKCAAFPTYNT